jgi:hypothetical protein
LDESAEFFKEVSGTAEGVLRDGDVAHRIGEQRLFLGFLGCGELSLHLLDQTLVHGINRPLTDGLPIGLQGLRSAEDDVEELGEFDSPAGGVGDVEPGIVVEWRRKEEPEKRKVETSCQSHQLIGAELFDTAASDGALHRRVASPRHPLLQMVG